MYVFPTRISSPSFKRPFTQVLKSRISWISWGMKAWSYETMNVFIKSSQDIIILFLQFFGNISKISIYVPWVWPRTKNLSCTSSNTFLIVRKDKNASKWWFLLFFTQLSIWRNNFLGNGLTLMNFFGAFNVTTQREPPCINFWKNAFCGSWSNRVLDSLMGSFSKAQSNHNNNPIVKFKSFG
jgi:hypothetical protein